MAQEEKTKEIGNSLFSRIKKSTMGKVAAYGLGIGLAFASTYVLCVCGEAQAEVVAEEGYIVEVFATEVQPPSQNGPGALAFDSQGNLYIAPEDYLRILKIPAGTNIPEEFGAVAIRDADGVAVDSQDNIIASGTPYVYKFAPDGSVIWRVHCPIGNVQLVAVDSNDNAYVGSLGTQIAKIPADGSSVTVLGNFSYPSEPAVSPDGFLYISQRRLNIVKASLDTADILEVVVSGVDATQPVFDASGDLFIGNIIMNDDVMSGEILKISLPDGTISTVATGFTGPRGLALDADGNLFVSDYRDKIIYKISPAPAIECKGRILVYNTEDRDDRPPDKTVLLGIFDDLHTILEDYGYDVDIKERITTPAITSELLSNYDQLWFMSTKREADVPGVLTQSEIDAVLDFRTSCKGLLICAEHKGTYDYTDEANQISVPLGVEFWGYYYYGNICALPDIDPSFPLWDGVNELSVLTSEPTFTVLDPTAVEVIAVYSGNNLAAVRDEVNRTVFEASWVRFSDFNINLCDNSQYARNMADWLAYCTKILATIDIKPDTLNLKSHGKWITAYIELPEGYDVNDIDVSTILLEDTIPAELKPTRVGDRDKDGIADLKVKFDRAAVKAILEPAEEVELIVTGELNDGTAFEGSDIIRVIDKCDKCDIPGCSNIPVTTSEGKLMTILNFSIMIFIPLSFLYILRKRNKPNQ